jgi:hypothetical protein
MELPLNQSTAAVDFADQRTKRRRPHRKLHAKASTEGKLEERKKTQS